jgi:hypothetical protein
MFERLVNLLPILKDLEHTFPNVELPEIKTKKIAHCIIILIKWDFFEFDI